MRLSNCQKTNLFRNKQPFHTFEKSLNPYPNIEAQTTGQIQPIENYENSTVIFDDQLLSKQARNIFLFLREGSTIFLISFIYLKTLFAFQKLLFVKFLI